MSDFNLEEQSKKSEKVVKALTEFAPETLNGAVIFHLDKQTKEVKSFSPIMPADSIPEMYQQLAAVKVGIESLMSQLVKGALPNN